MANLGTEWLQALHLLEVLCQSAEADLVTYTAAATAQTWRRCATILEDADADAPSRGAELQKLDACRDFGAIGKATAFCKIKVGLAGASCSCEQLS
eukprot:s2456_g10.t1